MINDLKKIREHGFFDYSIADIHALYLSKKIQPSDLIAAAHERIVELNATTRAWVSLNKKAALDQAMALNESKISSLLYGIPVGVKDIMNTRDFPTQMGSEFWKNFCPGNDARIVHMLKYDGACVVGKTDSAELGVHTLNTSINPHNRDLSPGTSSSGSAVAIASGMVPFALGTQTAGSIVRPASYCGIYGFKPSFGLIPRTGVLKTADSLDTIGYFTLHARDLGLVFEHCIVHGPDYPVSHRLLKKYSQRSKGSQWNVGLVKSHVWAKAEPYATQSLLDWLHCLSTSSNLEIREFELPAITKEAHRVQRIIYHKSLAYYFKEEYEQRSKLSDLMVSLIEEGNSISADEYKDALRLQEAIAQEVDDFFRRNELDAAITLSTAGQAVSRFEREVEDSALLWTMSYVPVVSAPAFLSPQGNPFGMQIIGRRYSDRKIFALVDHLVHKNFLPKIAYPSVDLNHKGLMGQVLDENTYQV